MCHHKSAAHATGHLTLPLLDLLFRLDWLACLQDKQANPKAKPPAPSPLLLGLAPTTYVLRVVARVRSSELEQALLHMRHLREAAMLLRQPGAAEQCQGEPGEAAGCQQEQRRRRQHCVQLQDLVLAARQGPLLLYI